MNGSNVETPPGPSVHILDKDDAYHSQYATYPSGDKEAAWNNVEGLSHVHFHINIHTKWAILGTDVKAHQFAKGWVPMPLRAWFWIPLVIFMILTAVGLEIALYYSKKLEGKSFIYKLDIF